MSAPLLAAPVLDPATWAALPFHFWTVVFFVLGAIVGSFLNVCIHRMPRGESLMRPPSHCPHCGTRIPWWQNVPILAWVALRGRCARCGAGISVRYLAVEALTGALFAVIWVVRGGAGPWVAGAFCAFAAALVVATFIDIEHLIIPDEITLGGAVAGVVLSVVLPGIHGALYVWPALKAAVLGAALGSGVIFAMLELGKLFLGKQRFQLPAEARLVFTETDLHLPDRTLPYEDVFYRNSDTLTFHARTLELPDRCYRNAAVRLQLRAGVLRIGDEEIDPSTVPWMEGVADQVTVPREAMGFGDVKFMAAIGAFTGWEGVLFTLLGSSVTGVVVNAVLSALGRREWTARLPFGPYLAAGALGWILGGHHLFDAWLGTFGAGR